MCRTLFLFFVASVSSAGFLENGANQRRLIESDTPQELTGQEVQVDELENENKLSKGPAETIFQKSSADPQKKLLMQENNENVTTPVTTCPYFYPTMRESIDTLPLSNFGRTQMCRFRDNGCYGEGSEARCRRYLSLICYLARGRRARRFCNSLRQQNCVSVPRGP